MEIIKTQENESLVLAVSGRLETVTAPQLEAEVKAIPESVKELVLDFAGLEFVSSAGLRVILFAQKVLKSRGGKVVVRSANESVKKIFKITGFAPMLSFD